MIRAFIGVEIATEVRGQISEAIAQLAPEISGIRWVPGRKFSFHAEVSRSYRRVRKSSLSATRLPRPSTPFGGLLLMLNVSEYSPISKGLAFYGSV